MRSKNRSRELHEEVAKQAGDRLDRLRDEVLDRPMAWLDRMHEALSQQMDDALNEGDEWRWGRCHDEEEGL